MPVYSKKKSDKQECLSMSLKNMVNKIKEKPDFFEGNSHIIINKIKEIINKGDSGWSEINDAWNVELEGKAKKKIDKYFNKGLKIDNGSLKNIKHSDKEEISEPIGVKDNEILGNTHGCEMEGLVEGIKNRVKKTVHKKVVNVESKVKTKKESKIDEGGKNINNIETDSLDCFINDLTKGVALSENGLSHINCLMSYIRIRKPIDPEDNTRKELDYIFKKIISSLINIEDKNKVLHLYREHRFLSVYNSSCRVVTHTIASLLEKKGFHKEIITKIEEYLINYSKEYLVKFKSNGSKYNDHIKNIKKFSDFDVLKEVEGVEKIVCLKGILSENRFTSEGRKFLTELSHDLNDGRIIDFIKEKINLDVELLQSEHNDKCTEEQIAYNEYIKEKDKIIDANINRIKSIIIMKKIPESIVSSVVNVINKRRRNINIELFSSKIDLIINILQCKVIKVNKITNDIEYYLNLSVDKLKLEAEVAKSKKTSFQARISSLFNGLNNRVLNFIYNVRHSFQ